MYGLKPTTQTEEFRQKLIEQALDLAILEDLGSEQIDVTTASIVTTDRQVSGSVYCKQEAVVVAGLQIFAQVLEKFDKRISVKNHVAEGQFIESTPTVIATFEGPASSILKGERIALNLLQRMSAIATVTHQYVELAKPFGIEIRDTRKTTPGLRVFEREAVRIAGGQNHRFGLFDAILIKDNHIQFAGGIETAINNAKKAYPELAIEVEATTLEQVEQALKLGVQTILLDNMNAQTIREAVALIKGTCFIEVSGGVNLKNIKNYLIEGVNAISIGALTHSAPNIDISLEVEI
ncbi:MAG: carboxylating nicotinate-nucleotide diphosphorylase [Candidatus Melainabacteria bacterium]|nr:MAG: carboxylating nicotinate-nucleotide diphosphorylase [Candidatus Melainabacteria bacterium]